MKTTLIAVLAVLSLISAVAPVAAFDLGYAGSSIVAGPGFDLIVERRKPRVPGGSGCNTPRDVREHPECRA